MKKLFVITIFFAFVGSAFAQSYYEKDNLIRLMDAAGYDVSSDEYETYLAKDDYDSFWKTFYSGNDYIIVAFPEEEGVYDLDIYLIDEYGNEIDKGTTENLMEILTYSGTSDQRLKVKIKNYDSYSSSSRYKVHILVFWK